MDEAKSNCQPLEIGPLQLFGVVWIDSTEAMLEEEIGPTEVPLQATRQLTSLQSQ